MNYVHAVAVRRRERRDGKKWGRERATGRSEEERESDGKK